MPLDPSWPPQRLQELCDEVQPASVVWAAAGTSGGHGAPAVTGWPLVELPALAGLHGQGGGEKQQQAPAAAAAGAAAAASAQRAQPPLAAAAAVSPAGEDASYPGQPGADDCCYLMFTSGSTGRPLAVCGTEPGVLNRCRWLQQACPFQVSWVLLAVCVIKLGSLHGEAHRHLHCCCTIDCPNQQSADTAPGSATIP